MGAGETYEGALPAFEVSAVRAIMLQESGSTYCIEPKLQHNRDRVVFRSRTDGGRLVVAQLVRDGVRPITAWEEER